MAECIHELEEATCSMCRPRHATQAPQTRSLEFGPWVSASYGGECTGCGDAIERGDSIRSDGCGHWLCQTCGSA